jgi:hypothetical protein
MHFAAATDHAKNEYQTPLNTGTFKHKWLKMPVNTGVSPLGTSIYLKNSSFPRRRESNFFADQPFTKLGFPPVDGDAIRRAGTTGFLEVHRCYLLFPVEVCVCNPRSIQSRYGNSNAFFASRKEAKP